MIACQVLPSRERLVHETKMTTALKIASRVMTTMKSVQRARMLTCDTIAYSAVPLTSKRGRASQHTICVKTVVNTCSASAGWPVSLRVWVKIALCVASNVFFGSRGL
jgi:hypothetical protein